MAQFKNLFAQRLAERLQQLNCNLKAYNPGTIYEPQALLLIDYRGDLLAFLFFKAITDTIEDTSSKDYNYKLEYQFFPNNQIGVTIRYSHK